MSGVCVECGGPFAVGWSGAAGEDRCYSCAGPNGDRANSAPEEAADLGVLSAAEVCALPDPPKGHELVGPLLARGGRLVLGGHTGEGKTTLSLQLVRSVAFGGWFLDWQASKGRVLVIDAEQGLKTIKRRLREAGLDRSSDVDYLRVPDGLALDSDDEQAAAVEAVLAGGDYALVLADPLYKLHRGDSNSEREAVDLMRRFDRWREAHGFGLVLPAHCRKPQQGGAKFTMHEFFGQSAYLRGAEVVLGLQRLSDGYSRLHFFKDRDGDLPIGGSWGLLFDREQGFRREPEDSKPKQTESEKAVELRGEVFDYIREHAPVSNKRLEDGVKGRRERIREAVSWLEQDDLVHRTPQGWEPRPNGSGDPGATHAVGTGRAGRPDVPSPPVGAGTPGDPRPPASPHRVAPTSTRPHPAGVPDDYDAERQRVLDKFPDLAAGDPP